MSAVNKRLAKLGALSLLFGLGNALLPMTPVQASTDPVQVTGTPALYPLWSTQIYNYVTRCNNSPVGLAVAATNGVKVSVDGQTAQTGNFNATVNNYTAGQEFVITTVNAVGKSSTYHVRCLPSDFPTWTTQINGPRQARFYVVTPSLCVGCTQYPYVVVFDNNGVPRWWKNTGTPVPLDAKSLPDGNLLWQTYISLTSGAPAPVEYGLDGKPVRSYPSASGTSDIDFHEIQVLPNGRYLLATDTKKVTADLTPCGAPAGTTGPVIDPVLEELNPDGTLYWSWDTFAHIPLSEVAPMWYPECRGSDAYHFNALEDFPATLTGHGEAVLVSFRHTDAVYKIDLATGNILWKLGGTHRAESLTVVNDPIFTNGGGFSGQHDVRLSSNGDVTVHDNGTGQSRPPRAVRYAIDVAARTATLEEQVSDPSLTSFCCGSVRKLYSGNWVTSWGGTPHIEEITPSNTIVFNLTLPGSVFSYRAAPVTGGPGRYGEGPGWGDALTVGMNSQYPRPPGG